jgi:hypothetical protein
MTVWASVEQARTHWPIGAAISDAAMADLLAAAQVQAALYARALTDPDTVPFTYTLAVIYQARELYNAGQRDNADAVGVGDFVIRARPLTATVKQLLRPASVTWGVG